MRIFIFYRRSNIEGQKFYKIEARYIYGVKQLENLADFCRKLYRPELEKEISQ